MPSLDLLKHQLVKSSPQGTRALGLVLVSIAVPTAIRASLDEFVTGTTFFAYYPFVLIAALVLNWRHVLLVAVLSAIIANFLFVAPGYSIFTSSTQMAAAISFLLSSAMIAAVGYGLRTTVIQLEKSRTREAHFNQELQHRVKNTLTVVQGLAIQTFRDTPAAKAPTEKLLGRINALAQANDVLRSGSWENCCLPDLAIRALKPFNIGDAIMVSGPECSIPDDSCVPLVLALHELATNAVKYGALSVEGGIVSVNWAVVPEGGTRHSLVLEWKERHGPKVQGPTREGLGSKLLRPQGRLVAVDHRFDPDGVSCRFQIRDVTPDNSSARDIENSPANIELVSA
jgi:two-component sensor histidine kinase